LGQVLFCACARVEYELDPALSVFGSDVVLDGSTNLSLSEEIAVHKLIEIALFDFNWHFGEYFVIII
jgi:hypothetical protein